MATGIQQAWSTTASTNGSADSNINAAEGMTPAAVNDSMRAQMAAHKGFANQISGAKTSGGSANAQTFTSDSVAAITSYAAGRLFCFKAGYTNTTTTPTFNVDGVGAKTIKKGGAQAALAAGDITAGGIYWIAYEASGDCFLLLNPDTGAISSQPLDETLNALAALSYTSGTLYLTMTGADTFALADNATLIKTTGAQTMTGRKTFNYNNTTVFNRNDAFPSFLIELQDNTTLRGYIGASSSYPFIASNSIGTPILFADSNGAYDVSTNYIRVAGKTAVPIPASAMVPNTTNGAAPITSESSTNKVMTRTLDFDQTTQEGAQFLIPMPKGWNEGTVTFQPLWTASSGTGGVVWELRALALSDDDAIDQAFGTGQTSTDTLIATGDVHIGPESSAITIAGTPAEGDMVVFQIRRNVSDGSDTLTADAKLLGIRLYLTTNAKNDA